MSTNADRAAAFEAAIAQVDRMLARDPHGSRDAALHARLARLRDALVAERIASAERGAVDEAWLRDTVRDVDGWVSDDDLSLLAALGRIARAK